MNAKNIITIFSTVNSNGSERTEKRLEIRDMLGAKAASLRRWALSKSSSRSRRK